MKIEHKHLIIRAEVLNPFRERATLWEWMESLIPKLGMELLSGPYVEYVADPGNVGLTGVCIIKTSHIAVHIWEESDPAVMQIDVYSCGPLDPNIVFQHLIDWAVEPTYMAWKFLDREHDLKVILSSDSTTV